MAQIRSFLTEEMIDGKLHFLCSESSGVYYNLVACVVKIKMFS